MPNDLMPIGMRSELVSYGVHRGITWGIRQVMWGAMNGYAKLPEGHPYYHADLMMDSPFVVHGGITYQSENGWVGFDTLHLGDIWPDMPSMMKCADMFTQHWTQSLVEREVLKLCNQIAMPRELTR